MAENPPSIGGRFMQISVSTSSFSGEDVSTRIDELVESNAEGKNSEGDLNELCGLLRLRNEHSNGTGWYSGWDETEFVSDKATEVLADRIKSRVTDEHGYIDFDDSPFKHINWDDAVNDEKEDMEEATLTIGFFSGTYFVFDES